MSARNVCLGLAFAVSAAGCHGPAPVALGPAAPAARPRLRPQAPPPGPKPAPVAAAAGAALTAQPARREGQVQRRLLPGGAQLIVERDPLASTVAIDTFVTVGAWAETEPGSRHLLERLLLDRESPSGLLAARLRAQGSEVVSFTAPDYTLYQVVTPRLLWRSSLDLIPALLSEPPLSAAALAGQQKAVRSELAQAPGDGESLRRLLAARLPEHPYKRPLLGTADSIARLCSSGAALQELHHLYYRPDQLTVVVVGDVDPDEVAGQLSARLAQRAAIAPAPADEALLRAAAPPPLAPGPRVTAFVSAAQPELLLGFAVPAAPGLTAAELAALDVAAVALSAKGSPSFLVSGLAPGALVLRTRVSTAAGMSEAARSGLTAALQLAARRLPAAELERAQRRLLQAGLQRSELPGGQAQRLGAFALLGIDPAAYETSLRALTPFELQAVLRRYLTLDNLTLAAAAGSPPLSLDVNRLSALIATTAATVARSTAPAPTEPPERLDGRAQLYRLRSGARVVFFPDERVKSAAVAAFWPGGQRLEDERAAGLHELLARAWPRTLRACTATAPDSGSQLEAAAESDGFGLGLELMSSDLESAVAGWRECLEHPQLSDADLERARRGLLAAAGSQGPGLSGDAAADRLAWRLLKRGLLGSHPYAAAGPPTEQSLVGLTRRRLLDFYHQHYGREHLVLAVVGDVAPAALLGELEPWLGAATPASAADLARERLLHEPTPQTQATGAGAAQLPGQLFAAGAGQEAHLILGFPAPGRRPLLPGSVEPDRAAVELLLELLAPSPDEGRLPRALLARRGLVHAFSGQLSTGILPGYLAFSLTTAPGQLEVAEATLRDELHRLIDHPVPGDELALARGRLLARRALAGQRRIDQAERLARAVALGLPDRLLDGEDPEARLLAVDARSVQAAAAAVLREERLLRAAVLPAPPAPAPMLDPSKGRLVASREPVALPQAAKKSQKPKKPSNSPKHRRR